MSRIDRNKLRRTGTPPRPMPVDLVHRNSLRGGFVPQKPEEILPVLEEKEPISIIISAYQTQDFIEECLSSVEKQTYFVDNDDFEVLVGVDACQDTLNKLLEIRDKYRNLRIFMMETNKGTYVTTNTLLRLVKSENIIRFDSDDVMMPEMINEIMYHSKEHNFIRFRYLKMQGNEQLNINHFPHGVVFIKKSLIKELGGYKPWTCAADSELMIRGKELINEKLLNKILFYRRMHGNSLTRSKQFGAKSDIREKYRKRIGKHKVVKIRRIMNKYMEV